MSSRAGSSSLDGTQPQVRGGLTTERDLTSVNLKHAWVAAGSASPGRYRSAREEAQLHEAGGLIFRQIESLQDPRLPLPQLCKVARTRLILGCATIETHFHLALSIHSTPVGVNPKRSADSSPFPTPSLGKKGARRLSPVALQVRGPQLLWQEGDGPGFSRFGVAVSSGRTSKRTGGCQ